MRKKERVIEVKLILLVQQSNVLFVECGMEETS
jgi:hypothetical protein